MIISHSPDSPMMLTASPALSLAITSHFEGSILFNTRLPARTRSVLPGATRTLPVLPKRSIFALETKPNTSAGGRILYHPFSTSTAYAVVSRDSRVITVAFRSPFARTFTELPVTLIQPAFAPDAAGAPDNVEMG